MQRAVDAVVATLFNDLLTNMTRTNLPKCRLIGRLVAGIVPAGLTMVPGGFSLSPARKPLHLHC